MRTLFNYWLPLRDWLYILQLEEYNVPRYLKQLKLRLFSIGFEQRDQLRLTARIQLVRACVLGLLLLAALLAYIYQPFVLLTIVLTMPLLVPLLVGISSLLIQPLAHLLTRRCVARARNYFTAEYPNTKVIALTGSYGKTTTKYLLHALLEHTFKTAIIPENRNTLLGIADYILSGKTPKSSEYLIVEIGAYVEGDIAACMKMLSPDIAIITALGDQHLERFGSLENLYHAKYELFSHSPERTKCYTTTAAADLLRQHQITDRSLIEIPGTNSPADNQALAVKVAEDLNVSEAFIADGVKKFTPPGRRGSTFQSGDVLVIDNSYNISPQTAEAMIRKATAKAEEFNKDLVVMTAGIAEQGVETEAVNTAFGELLNQHATRVILHPSVYAPTIESSLTIPVDYHAKALDVLNDLAEHVNGRREILLHLPEHGDLAYL